MFSFLFSTPASADTSGPLGPGTMATDNGSGGIVDWTSPDNAKVEDGTTTTSVLVMEIGSIFDHRVRIVKGGAIGSTDKANGTAWPGSLAYTTYGSSSDLWGESWAVSDINASNFGVAISAYSPGAYTSYYLKATNFGFSIPDGATIDGITVEVKKRRGGAFAIAAWIDYIRITVNYTSNTAPTGVFNSATQKTDGTGKVDTSIAVSDADTNNSKAKIEYTTDATCATGRTKATLTTPIAATVGVTPDLTQANAYQIGTTTPIITSSANTITFEWDSKTDLPNAAGGANYYLCLTANDGAVDQTSIGASSAIAVDNVAPSSVSAPTFGTITTTSIEVVKPSSVTEAGSGLYQWQARRNSASELGFNAIATTSITDSTLSANTQYTYDIEFNDAIGNVSSYGTTAQKYTLANMPDVPIVDVVGTTSIYVNPVTGGAESAMAIYVEQGSTCDGSSGLGYVQANGSISDSAVWQSDATWSTVTTIGLTPGARYSFCAKARNGDSTETAFGLATSATTNSNIGGGGSSYYPASFYSVASETPLTTAQTPTQAPTPVVAPPSPPSTSAPVVMTQQQKTELITQIKQQLITLVTQLIQLLTLQVGQMRR